MPGVPKRRERPRPAYPPQPPDVLLADYRRNLKRFSEGISVSVRRTRAAYADKQAAMIRDRKIPFDRESGPAAVQGRRLTHEAHWLLISVAHVSRLTEALKLLAQSQGRAAERDAISAAEREYVDAVQRSVRASG